MWQIQHFWVFICLFINECDKYTAFLRFLCLFINECDKYIAFLRFLCLFINECDKYTAFLRFLCLFINECDKYTAFCESQLNYVAQKCCCLHSKLTNIWDTALDWQNKQYFHYKINISWCFMNSPCSPMSVCFCFYSSFWFLSHKPTEDAERRPDEPHFSPKPSLLRIKTAWYEREYVKRCLGLKTSEINVLDVKHTNSDVSLFFFRVSLDTFQ